MDKEAKFISIYDLHWSELYAYTINVVRNNVLAEDIVQEVFMDFWKRMDSVQVDLPRAYLFRAIKNKCASQFAKQKLDDVQIEKIVEILPELDDKNYTEIKSILLEEIEITANKILPEKCLQIFKLRFYNQLSYKEIAIQLEISENTVENQISKALKLLRNSATYPIELILLVLSLQ